MKTKLNLTRFGLTFGTLRFDEKSFFKTFFWIRTILGLKPSNAVHADSPAVYTCEKILNLSLIDTNHLKCNVTDISVVKGVRRHILFSLILNKPPGYKILSESKTLHYKKT